MDFYLVCVTRTADRLVGLGVALEGQALVRRPLPGSAGRRLRRVDVEPRHVPASAAFRAARVLVAEDLKKINKSLVIKCQQMGSGSDPAAQEGAFQLKGLAFKSSLSLFTQNDRSTCLTSSGILRSVIEISGLTILMKHHSDKDVFC